MRFSRLASNFDASNFDENILTIRISHGPHDMDGNRISYTV